MPSYDSSERAFKSLSAQIRETEAQVLECRENVKSCAGVLLQKTQQQMIAPSSLLLAGGMGFIIGELMKLKTSQRHGQGKDSAAQGNVPITQMLMDALNTFNTISSIYTSARASMRPEEERDE
ncbi:hypothetical protein ABF87_06480 [Nitrosomonas sp. JL21]|uniref:hypothetical protein n=1 Tax=Nitrosomonas sp. JL21 TaxID=153949 RepID=UPI00136D3A1F|nr:hypothetical protein [Nitrosomonas sp. JL21]MBL8496842.1 hypothetical protein [Nitrosomonas sp.]MBL8498406.1 hypothetical protein [Nitrosomonas sp.]MCC7090834.1 hypothetical protein [Nitrosomonas sp.]MXS77616.1 hypothetical protein [Nitrosomonas sp. JL21]